MSEDITLPPFSRFVYVCFNKHAPQRIWLILITQKLHPCRSTNKDC